VFFGLGFQLPHALVELCNLPPEQLHHGTKTPILGRNCTRADRPGTRPAVPSGGPTSIPVHVRVGDDWPRHGHCTS
jgi:hypothetical protein